MAPTQEEIMGKLISKCCVCGRIYGVLSMPSIDGERYSHGYCSKECMKFTPVQVMVWDKTKNCRLLDAAHMNATGRIFYRDEAIDKCITFNKKEQRIDSLFWNDVMYEIAEFEPVDNDGHANRILKEAVEDGCIAVL